MKHFFGLLILILIIGGCKQNANKQAPQLSNSTADTNTPTETELAQINSLLDSIHTEDQKYRKQLNEIKEKYGPDSEELQNHWETISKTDASNLVIVEEILEKHGWLGIKEIGGTANSTLFLVIQHSDQKTQEKYLTMMQQAVKDKKANAQSLALLEDRIGIGKGEFQVYGSQIGKNQETGKMYVLPLLDPDNVDKRRAEVGLGPIEDYVSHWDLVWDVEEYKKQLPKLSAKLKSDIAKYEASKK